MIIIKSICFLSSHSPTSHITVLFSGSLITIHSCLTHFHKIIIYHPNVNLHSTIVLGFRPNLLTTVYLFNCFLHFFFHLVIIWTSVLLKFRPSPTVDLVYPRRLLWPSQGSLLLLAPEYSPLRPPQLWTHSFLLMPAWFTPRVPDSYRTLSCLADSSTLWSLCTKFLYDGSDVCLRLPSTSVSRRTPLPSVVDFPLSSRLGDFHPLEYVRAGRTQKKQKQIDSTSVFTQ